MRVWISLKLVIGKGSDTAATSLQDAGPELIELPDQKQIKTGKCNAHVRQSRCTMLCEKLRQGRCCKSTARCTAQKCGIATARHTAQKCGKAAAHCCEPYAAKMLHAAKPLQGCTGNKAAKAAAKLSRCEMHRKIRRQNRCNTPQCGRAAAASDCGEAAAGCTGKQGGKAAAKLISLPAWHRYSNGGSLSTQTISARALDKTPASSLLKLA